MTRKMVSCSTINRVLKGIAAFFSLSVLTAYAGGETPPWAPPSIMDGNCFSYPQVKLVAVFSSAAFTSNKQGAMAEINFSANPASYDGWCYSAKDVKNVDSGNYQFFWAEGMAPGSNGASTGWAGLTDDIEIRTMLNIEGKKVAWGTASPVSKYSSIKLQGQGYTSFHGETLGTSGYVWARLRRTIVGGAIIIPAGIHIAQLRLSAGTGSAINTSASVFDLYTSQLIVPVPTECKINGGKTMDIRFGNIDSSRLTTSAASSEYQQPGNLTYVCNSSLSQEMMVQLVADSAGFGDAIKTSNPDIGVVMQRQNTTVKPGEGFKVQLSGSDAISFSLVGNGKKPTAGPFTGSAALVLTSL